MCNNALKSGKICTKKFKNIYLKCIKNQNYALKICAGKKKKL